METGPGGTDPKPSPRSTFSSYNDQDDAIDLVRQLGREGKIYLAEIIWNEAHDSWFVRVDHEKKE